MFQQALRQFYGTQGIGALSAAVAIVQLSPIRCEPRRHEQKEQPQLNFDTIDTNRDGVIDRDEFMRATAGRSDSRLVLAGDIGGTNSRLKLYMVNTQEQILRNHPAPGVLVFEKRYNNIEYRTLMQVLEQFMKDATPERAKLQNCDEQVAVACLAVAGVVTDNVCRLTNVDWTVSGGEIEAALDVQRVEVINDFVAQGYGVLTLSSDDVICLHDAPVNPTAPIACIGAGTGLGECFLTPTHNGQYTAFPSEGGHAEWAPRGQGSDETQIELLKWLKIKFSGWNRVSVERVASGPGISNIYEYLAWREPQMVDRDVHNQFLLTGHSPRVITSNDRPGSLCDKALSIFCQCYGSEAGVVALTYMPFGGLYLTGGITTKLVERITQNDHLNKNDFMDAYWDKGRVSPLLSRVPVYVVPENRVSMGERGSHLRAVQLLKEGFGDSKKATTRATSTTPLVPPRDTMMADILKNARIE